MICGGSYKPDPTSKTSLELLGWVEGPGLRHAPKAIAGERCPKVV